MQIRSRTRTAWLLLAAAATLAGCGGGGGGDGSGSAAPAPAPALAPAPAPAPTIYTIGGSVAGLQAGDRLELGLGSQQVAVTADGNFAFATGLAAGAAYSVQLMQTPTGRHCGVWRGTGTVQAATVTDVRISCVSRNWVTNGAVGTMTLAPDGNTLYLAGSFSRVGPRSGNFVAVDAVSGARRDTAVLIGGAVATATSDGSGGWYVAVAALNGPGTRLQRIRADGRVDAGFAVTVGGNVSALARVDSRLFVGGSFTSIADSSRNNLAILDAATGAVLTPAIDTEGHVSSIATGATQVFIGGLFSRVRGVDRQKLAALDRQTSQLLPWAPSPQLANSVASVSSVMVANGVVYAAGRFDTIGGQARNSLAALDPISGLATAWRPEVGAAGGPGSVCSMASNGAQVFVGGTFQQIGGQARNGAAAVDATTGLVTAWDAALAPWPHSSVTVCSIASAGDHVYLAGQFASAGGAERPGLASVSAATGAVTPFAADRPTLGGVVSWLGASGSEVWIGGGFELYGGVTRNGMAALDTRTGQALPWAPDVRSTEATGLPGSGAVSQLLATASAVFVAGRFDRIGGDVRHGIGAVDSAGSGATLPWMALPARSGTTPYVDALVLGGNTLYFGGDFDSVSGQPRRSLAAVNASTFSLDNWSTTVPGRVHVLSLNNGRVFAVGSFAVDNGPRALRAVLAFDAGTGAQLAWDPDPRFSGESASVNSLVTTPTAVYMAGFFDTIAGDGRFNLAAVSAERGDLLPWLPGVHLGDTRLFLAGDTLLTSLPSTSLMRETSYKLSPRDQSTGAIITGWELTLDDAPLTMLAAPNSYYIGGRFRNAGGEAANGIVFAPR